MSKLWIYLLGILLLSTVVSATFSATLENNKYKSNEIYTDEIAEFTLNIKNLGAQVDRFQIYPKDPNWIARSNESLMEVKSGESKNYLIKVDPTSKIDESGNYRVELVVKSIVNGDLLEFDQQILILSDEHRTFQPAVSLKIDVENEDSLSPGDPIKAKLLFNNRNALDIKGLEVSINSNLIEDFFVVDIAPNGNLIKHVDYTINKFTEPQSDVLVVDIRYENKTLASKSIDLQIAENKEFFLWDTITESKFMYTRYVVNLTNDGNVPSTETFEYPVGLIRSWFSEPMPDAEYVDGKYVFTLDLDPSESQAVVVVSDYRTFFWTTLAIGVFLFLSILGYYTFRSPIVLSKRAIVVGRRDGGSSEIKVLINLKNRSGKVFENLKIVDRIPGITEIEREFSLGTLKPQKIVRHPKKGTLIRWEFPSMDAYEERILTYRIHSKLGILGDLSLPATVIKFTSPDGGSRLHKSNFLKKGEI